MARPLAPCGTRSAYTRHLRNGEAPCEACKAANAAYAKPNNAARQRAWQRLAARYPEAYKQLLAEEIAKEKGDVR